MADESDLKFKISADIQEVEAALGKLKEDLGETEEATRKNESASKKAAGAFADMAAKAVLVWQGIQKITEGVAEFERQAGIINRFQGDVSEATRRVNGLATSVELMASQQAMANRGLELGTKDFANFAVAVQEYAAATGKDAVAVQEEFGEALATGSVEGLNKFGVVLGEVTGIQDAQTQALEQLETKYGDVSSSADTLAGQLGTLQNRLNDVAVALFDSVGKAFEATRAQDELGSSVEATTEFWEDLTQGVREGVGAIVGLFNGLIEKAAQTFTAMEELGELIEAIVDFDFDRIIRESADFDKAIANVTDFDNVLSSAVDGMNAATIGGGKLAQTVETKMNPALAKGAEKLGNLGDAAKDAAKEMAELVKLMDSVAGNLDAGNLATDQQAAQLAFEGEQARAAFEKLLSEREDGLATGFGAEQGGGGSLINFEATQTGAKAATEEVTTLGEELEKLYATSANGSVEFASTIGGALGTVQGAISATIVEAVKGEKSMSEAFEALASNLLVSIGEFMVGDGIKNIFLGVGRALSSYGLDATAAGLIGLGAAEVAAGIGLGAAGIAIAPPTGEGGGLAEPSDPNDVPNDAPSGPQTVVVQFQGVVPEEQVGRQTDDALRSAERRGLVRGR